MTASTATVLFAYHVPTPRQAMGIKYSDAKPRAMQDAPGKPCVTSRLSEEVRCGMLACRIATAYLSRMVSQSLAVRGEERYYAHRPVRYSRNNFRSGRPTSHS